MKKFLIIILSFVFVSMNVRMVSAGTVVWGNNATFGNVTLEAFDMSTGAVVDQFLAPNALAVADNGRGIAVVGTTIYYTVANRGEVFVTNSTTHADLGVAFNTGLNGIANVAWDGTALWVTGYNGTNNAYRYTPSGTLLQTVVGFGNSRDGFEIANNKIIANRGDSIGPYDLYDLNGNLIQSAFITTQTYNPTGITFDGSSYFVSDIYNNKIEKYDINGNFVNTTTLGLPVPQSGYGRLLEDLSSLGNIPDNPPPSVPEPATMLLLGSGIIALSILKKRK
ncbi:PEP-CTERM sorting domain-containing protein [Candidatus Desantisbacteria bacterium]|nr:PEP-CTERM sorting domain-containing protein [Candidatus Desantisbacteria bacterium]